MSFIPHIPDPKELVKSSVERAKRSAKQIWEKDRKKRLIKRELARVQVLGDRVSDKLASIVKSTVNFNQLNPFYAELISALIDINEVKKALAAVDWLAKKLKKMTTEYSRKITNQDVGEATRLRKQFEARLEDLVLSNKDAFHTLKEASKKLERLPKIKDMPTVVFAGYPNVGKSSLMKALTGSGVEIKSYPFTTKQILVGYLRDKYDQIQMVDTPGLLDRPPEKMNKIEKQALAAIKHLSNKLIFVVDPSESCGYPIEKQLNLLKSLKGFDVLVVASKSDISKPNFHVDIAVSIFDDRSIKELKNKIIYWVLRNKR